MSKQKFVFLVPDDESKPYKVIDEETGEIYWESTDNHLVTNTILKELIDAKNLLSKWSQTPRTNGQQSVFLETGKFLKGIR